MSCAGGSCGERIQKSEIDKWTTSINQMFISETGRQKFLNFLAEREMGEEVLTVHFWEKCDSIQKKISQRELPRNELIRKLDELVELADEHINFSLSEMNYLRNVLQERDSVKICDTLTRAKTSATRLLDRHHKIFSEQILREYKNRCH
nr:uncharacterized protein LOC106688211 [Halyomorpha halys]